MVSDNKSADKTVQYVPSTFEVHSFNEEILERKILFQVVKMVNSLLVYINDQDKLQFTDLSLAMNNRYDKESIGTRVVGNFTDEFSKNAACKIAKKLQKSVYISCNLDEDRFLTPLIQKRLFDEIKNNPEKFE